MRGRTDRVPSTPSPGSVRALVVPWLVTLGLVIVGLTGAAPAAGQTIRGEVVDASNGEPVPMAGLVLTHRDRSPVAMAMADSLGRFVLAAPEGGEYVIVAERFGYLQVESPLVAVSDGGEYAMDFELQPEPVGLSPVTVTVRNEELVEWLTLEMGINPVSAFGFRVLQGPRLQEAKLKGENDPTRTLRWLYIPVWHGGPCVSVNATPGARTIRFRGERSSVAAQPGAVPAGTRAIEADRDEDDSGRAQCGSLFVNDRVVPNELIDDVDMSQIAVVVTLPGTVRMYTYDFGWSFRNRTP